MICGSGGSKSRIASGGCGAIWPDERWTIARCCGAKHILKSKCTKYTRFRSLLEVEMLKTLWSEAHFEVKSAKNWRVQSAFGRSDVLSPGRRKGLCTLSKVSQTWGRGTFEEDLQRCISRGRRSTKDMFKFIRNVRRSGRWFPERGCILEHQIFRFAGMILRDRCSTSYDLASLFRGRRSTFDRWTGKIAKRNGTKLLALHSTFHFWRKSAEMHCFWCCQVEKLKKSRRSASFWCCQLWKTRKSRRIASFLMWSTSKNEEVSQNCFVFDVVNFKKWESLAEMQRFWCCQLGKMKKPRRVAGFSSLQIVR